jgi:hypothetical protein
MRGLLFGADAQVRAWAERRFGLRAVSCDKAIGIIRTDTQELVGAALFQFYSGYDVHFSYYGPNTASAGIARAMALVAVRDFDAARVTVLTRRSHKRLIRWLTHVGFRLEGSQRCYYGRINAPRNAALRYALFRPELARLAGLARAARAA